MATKSSDVVRIDADLKKEIESFQRAWARDHGEWLSQAAALKKMMGGLQ